MRPPCVDPHADHRIGAGESRPDPLRRPVRGEVDDELARDQAPLGRLLLDRIPHHELDTPRQRVAQSDDCIADRAFDRNDSDVDLPLIGTQEDVAHARVFH